ncbi:MAG: protein kinase [Verrucomicrobia bacterium]|nr:protein kinase [Verrucomicrobiota bacterium]
MIGVATTKQAASRKARLLVIDDDENARSMVCQVLKEAGHEVVSASTYQEGRKLLGKPEWDVVFSDLMLDEHTGLDLLREWREQADPAPFVLMTGQAEVDTAVEAMRMGALAYLGKPVLVEELLTVLKQALQEKQAQGEVPTAADASAKTRIVGRNRQMVEMYATIAKAAMSESPVMIFGELGVGKELVAREIHKHSARGSGPFITLNCSSLSGPDFEHDLLQTVTLESKPGHEGAGKPPCTVFMEHVQELPSAAQLKLARLVERRPEKRPTESGFAAGRPLRDVRYIATVVGGLESAEAMRKELFYAMSVIQIFVPPLRERLDDLPMLVRHLLDRIEVRVKKKLTVATSAMNLLRELPWPGNVRELAYAMEKAAAAAPRGELREEDFQHLLAARTSPARVMRSLSEVEQEHILSVFGQCAGDLRKAAEVLGVDSSELKRKLDSFGTTQIQASDASAVCAACGTIYSADESKKLHFRCPRCVGVEAAILVPSQPGEFELPSDVPKFKGNRYVLYKLLGRSEFSEVWAGWQPGLCRRVVIKFLIAAEEKLLERFKREARTQATLRHPRIPMVYEAGTDELNPEKMFLAIEFVEGQPMDQFSSHLAGKVEETERIRQVLTVGRQVAGALDYLHSQGLVHRDVKPQNIIATKDGNAYLIDYGITRAFRPDKPLTMEGFVLGTVPFMAPEQVAGRSEMLDGRVDVWGLGATLYYVLTGRLPFPGAQYEDVTDKIMNAAPEPPRKFNPAVSPGLEHILLRALEKNLDKRFPHAHAMAEAMEKELRQL